MAQKDLRRVRSAAQRVETAERRLREAMVKAQDSGESVRDIAPWAGLSASRVQQMLTQARREQVP